MDQVDSNVEPVIIENDEERQSTLDLQRSAVYIHTDVREGFFRRFNLSRGYRAHNSVFLAAFMEKFEKCRKQIDEPMQHCPLCTELRLPIPQCFHYNFEAY